MATQMIQQGHHQLGDQLETLRSTVRSLLLEVDEKSRPVQIDVENGIDFYEAVARFEAQLIESALQATGGRQNRAAGLLRLRRSTLNSKMKQLNLR
jgi:DNA-binding NtrC family response regulator